MKDNFIMPMKQRVVSFASIVSSFVVLFKSLSFSFIAKNIKIVNVHAVLTYFYEHISNLLTRATLARRTF